MPTKKFNDWNLNEKIDYSDASEIERELSDIPILKKWDASRKNNLYNRDTYSIKIIKGFKAGGNQESFRIILTLPRIFLTQISRLEKYAECDITPDVTDNRILMNFSYDDKLKHYESDSDLKLDFPDTGHLGVNVSYNTEYMGDLRKIFTSSLKLITDEMRDANYIFNKDIRKFPKLLKIMKEQVDETYQKMLDDLIDGDVAKLADDYEFDDETVMIMLARALKEDAGLTDTLNNISDEALDKWFKTIGGKATTMGINHELSDKLLNIKKIMNRIDLI